MSNLVKRVEDAIRRAFQKQGEGHASVGRCDGDDVLDGRFDLSAIASAAIDAMQKPSVPMKSVIMTDYGPVEAVDETHANGLPGLPSKDAYCAYVNEKATEYFMTHKDGLKPEFLGYRDWLAQTMKGF